MDLKSSLQTNVDNLHSNRLLLLMDAHRMTGHFFGMNSIDDVKIRECESHMKLVHLIVSMKANKVGFVTQIRTSLGLNTVLNHPKICLVQVSKPPGAGFTLSDQSVQGLVHWLSLWLVVEVGQSQRSQLITGARLYCSEADIALDFTGLKRCVSYCARYDGTSGAETRQPAERG